MNTAVVFRKFFVYFTECKNVYQYRLFRMHSIYIYIFFFSSFLEIHFFMYLSLVAAVFPRTSLFSILKRKKKGK